MILYKIVVSQNPTFIMSVRPQDKHCVLYWIRLNVKITFFVWTKTPQGISQCLYMCKYLIIIHVETLRGTLAGKEHVRTFHLVWRGFLISCWAELVSHIVHPVTHFWLNSKRHLRPPIVYVHRFVGNQYTDRHVVFSCHLSSFTFPLMHRTDIRDLVFSLISQLISNSAADAIVCFPDSNKTSCLYDDNDSC